MDRNQKLFVYWPTAVEWGGVRRCAWDKLGPQGSGSGAASAEVKAREIDGVCREETRQEDGGEDGR